MKLRSTIGAFVVAGALTLGVAAPAMADPPADPPRPGCVAARHVLHDLRFANRHLNRVIHRVEAAIERATNAGNTELAARLQARLDRAETRQDRVQARIVTVRAQIADRCTPAGAPAT